MYMGAQHQQNKESFAVPLITEAPSRNERVFVAHDFTTQDIRNDWREPRFCVLCDEPADCV